MLEGTTRNTHLIRLRTEGRTGNESETDLSRVVTLGVPRDTVRR